jgi:hypothetical protein
MADAVNIVALYGILKFTTFASAADLAEITARILLRYVRTVIGRSMECSIEQIRQGIGDSRELIRGNDILIDHN